MSRLAREADAVNLGQGFPDDPGPEDVRRKAAEAVVDGWNQYPPMMGLPELRGAVAAHYRHWQGLDLDPEREVMVTSGATEALAGALLALIEPGDEVVLFEPMYDAYLPLVRRAGGVPRFVTLQPPAFRLTEEALGARLLAADQGRPVQQSAQPGRRRSSPTRISRSSPASAGASTPSRSATRSGSTSSSTAAATCRCMALPGMRERTVKIGSAGKIFNLTGWKVGFVCAAPRAHAGARQGAPVPHLHDAAEPPGGRRLRPRQGRRLFRGAARATSRAAATASRPASTALGFAVIPSQGTYFLNIDIAPLGESRRRRLLPPPRRRARRRRDPGLGLLCRGRGAQRGALLLRQARRDARRGALSGWRAFAEAGLTACGSTKPIVRRVGAP